MKYKLIILFLIFGYSVYSQNNGIIKYKCTLVKEELYKVLKKSVSDTLPGAKHAIEQILNDTEPVSFTLKFNSVESLFYFNENMDSDYGKLNISKLIFGKKKYYTNIKEHKSLLQTESYGDFFLVDTSNENIKWELFNQSKMIGKYTCYKAIAKTPLSNNKSKTIVAWYAPSLNKPYGPLNFKKLPGMIMELTVKQGKIINLFEATEITLKEKNIKIKKPTKGKKITLKDFDEMGVTITRNKFKK